MHYCWNNPNDESGKNVPATAYSYLTEGTGKNNEKSK
jgi:hypothetical protein